MQLDKDRYLKEMDDLRRQIDEIDCKVVELLNRRARLADHIGDIKRKLGMPVYVPSREEQVVENIQKHNPGPLSGEALRRIYERIIDESRRLEKEEMERKEGSNNR